ncbi:RraA family protein [Nocardia bovistercoris]|uniref:Putative 4-hydroxy-4-methyl-2-oxoglutarate aldolase n=1 Tax=Nocardia bovistercoris TaxID=2785916 RepID=A0A931IAE4_9NOCA|nr:RraA family protein [Nocardia bovistercoris]MBH0777809.1 RraA family protein [Nocardia bovistercoris]
MTYAFSRLPVSALCDIDESLPVADPAIRPMTANARICGPAYTVIADGEVLSTLWAIARAAPGAVIVVQTNGSRLAVLGELFAAEAHRRGLAGIVVDGFIRDRRGLPPEFALWARGTVPNAGRSDVAPDVGRQICLGGVPVAPGDIVMADDDGIICAPRARLEACVEQAQNLERTEAVLRDRMNHGRSLIEMSNLADHVAALSSHRRSVLTIEPS